jgi:lipopolysaccharide export system protein LptA
MYRYSLSALLVSMLGICASLAHAAEETQTLLKVESVSLIVGGIEAKAEDIHLDVQRDGTRKLKLSGKVVLCIGELRATADNVEVSFATKSSMFVQLDGNVQIHSDELRATAHSARIDMASSTLDLHGGDGRSATMLRQIGDRASRIEAQNIRFDVKKKMIELKGAGTINDCADEEPW